MWEKFKDVPKLSYVYFFGDYHSWAYAPSRTPRYLAENMRLLKEHNVSDVFKCGWATEIGLDCAAAYVFSRLLEDPYRDPYALADEFCERAFGAGAEAMKKFFRTMYVNMDTPRGRSVIDELKQVPQAPERMFEAAFRPGTLNYMDSLLRQAERMNAADPKVKARLALVRRGFDFLRMRAKCYAVQEAWAATHDDSLLTLADRLYDERDAMLDAWYDDKGRMKPLDGFDWPYMDNVPKEKLIRGGGQVCPSFPELFRFGKGSVKELLKKKSFSMVDREFWEGYEECARRMLMGDGLADVMVDLKAHGPKGGDMKGVLNSMLEFRERHRDYIVDGKMVGELTPLEPGENVFGVFRRNRRGETALFVCATSMRAQTIRFRFPGSGKVETRELGLCSLHCFRERT